MVWGDKIDQFDIKQGENLVVSVDLESREYNGRWYTDVKAWKVSRSDEGASETYLSDPQEFKNSSHSNAPVLDDDIIPF